MKNELRLALKCYQENVFTNQIYSIYEVHTMFPDFIRMGTFIDSTHMKL